ncbi:MAG: SDR family NAD(P)-dependent oxidoreductase [Bacteroidia bacterium]
MKKTALITGASSGIGFELANIHAKNGGNLVLAARNIKKLEEIKKQFETEYNIKVDVFEIDLSKSNSAEEIYNFTKNNNLNIDYLINNAGFGDFGLFNNSNWESNKEMIQLNITSLTQLTYLYLQDMIKNKNGKIMNVASIAAFQPGPLMAVYFATKAYVLHFSEAIANEVAEFGITVTALCPGPTQSNFFNKANMLGSGLVKGKKLPSSKEVAIFGYKAMLNGKTVAVHGIKNKLLLFSNRFAPRNMVVKIVRMMQE